MVPAWGHYNPSVPRNPCFAASQFLVAASDRLIAGTDPLSINGDHMTSLCLQPHHKKRILEQMDTNGTCRNWTGREFMNSMKQLQHLCILVLQYLVNPHVQFVTWCCLSKHARKSPHIHFTNPQLGQDGHLIVWWNWHFQWSAPWASNLRNPMRVLRTNHLPESGRFSQRAHETYPRRWCQGKWPAILAMDQANRKSRLGPIGRWLAICSY